VCCPSRLGIGGQELGDRLEVFFVDCAWPRGSVSRVTTFTLQQPIERECEVELAFECGKIWLTTMVSAHW